MLTEEVVVAREGGRKEGREDGKERHQNDI